MNKDRADLGPPPTQRRFSTWETVRAVFYTVTITVLVTYLTHTLRMEREDLLVGQTQRQLETHAKLIAEGIQEFFADISQDLGVLARHPTILDKANRSLVTGEPSTETSLCQSFFEAHKRNIDALYILNARGVVVQAVPPMPEVVGIDMGDKPDVALVLREHRTHISEVFRAPSNDLAISILYPLFSNGEFAGAVRCVTHIETICNRFIHAVKIGESGYAWLLDDKGRILGHPRSGYVGRDLVTLNRDILPAHEGYGLESMVAGMTQGKAGVGICQSAWLSEEAGDSRNELVAYAPVRIDHGLWSVAVSMSYSETIGTFNRTGKKGHVPWVLRYILVRNGCACLLQDRPEKGRVISASNVLEADC